MPGLDNLVSPGGDRYGDKEKLIGVIRGALVGALSDIEVRRFLGVAASVPVESVDRERVARFKAPLFYASLIDALLLASQEEISGVYTGWAWKNSSVVYLQGEHFSGLVWDGSKWVQRVEKTGLNFGGIMRAGMCQHEKLNLTACDSLGVPIANHGPFVPFKVAGMVNGLYARTQHYRAGWTVQRRAAVLGAGWFLPWEPGEYGGFDDFGEGPVNLLYGPIVGAKMGDMVGLPWPDSTLAVKLYQFEVNHRAANTKEDGAEYRWAFGPFSRPPFLDSVRWLPFRENTGLRVFKYWFPGEFVRYLNA